MKTQKVTKYSHWFPWLALLVLAIISRFYNLTNKPLHFDEGINGWWVMQMDQLGFYKYDPNNYHGPLYFYLLQIFERIFGKSVTTLRAVPSFFNVLTVMLFAMPYLRDVKVRSWIAFFFLISPAFLFFGRSGIHEMPFVFFQVVFALGLLRWGEERDEKSLELALVGLFGMMTLKETFVLALASWGLGAIFLGPTEWRRQFSWAHLRQTWTRSTAWLFVVLFIIFIGLFTGFGRNPRGAWSFVEAFLPWMKTGVGENGHNKEFWYWLKVTWAAEPLAVLGMVLAVWGLFAKESAIRLVSAFSLCQFLLYSAIPYKTVWCIITLLWGFYFVLAMSIVKYWKRRGWQRWLLPVFVVLVLPLQFKSAYESVYKEPINMDHPYVYVNTTYEQKAIQDLILLKLQDPAFAKETIQLGMEEQWPWPWVFRNATTSWHHCGQFVSPDALAYFCDPKDSFAIENQLKQPYLKRTFQMRQARGPSLVYLRKNVFDGTATGDYEVVGPQTQQEHKE